MVYNDGFYWHGDNRLRQPSYTLLNGSVTMDLEDGKYQVRVWGKNLGNAKYYISEAEIQGRGDWRSEEHTSELQSLMRISYAVFCLKKKKQTPLHLDYTTQPPPT